jgi:peptide/nickel transport system substrate-binding protein
LRRLNLAWLATALLLCLAVVVTGCGGGDSGSGTKSTPVAGGGKPDEGKQGGDVVFLAAADVDYLDPGQTYYTFGFMVNYAVNRALYTFQPGDTEKAVADIADGDPQIADDNMSVTVKIKKGIKYAPPVNREVTTKDIKYAIERAFTSNVPSGYASSYFSEIEGAPSAPVKYAKLKPFSGLTTPDDQTLVIKLTKAVAPRVVAALVMPITMPVPEEYAKKYDAKSPSTYDQYVAFTGPYMVKNDSSGKVVGRQPGKKIELVRNPNWDKATDFRPAFLDSITVEEGNDDLTVAARRTLAGQKLICCDAGQPPIAILRRALQRNKDQLGRVSGGGTRWIAMNTTKKPFDNLNVRKAVLASFDRNALRLTRGGEEIGPIAQGFIPPGIPGHEESGGIKGFPDFDYMQKPEGDPEVAKKYMLEAKKEGVPVTADGKYDGKESILTIATNADPGLQTAQVAQSEFQKLGFKLNFRKVPQDTLYTKFCGVPKADVVICPNVGWFKDFQDPESMLQPTFSGDAIKPAGNVNWSQLKVPEIDAAMKKAALIPTGAERNKAWAEINKMIVGQAPGVPYSWDDSVSLASPDIKMVMNGYSTSPDLSFSSLK